MTTKSSKFHVIIDQFQYAEKENRAAEEGRENEGEAEGDCQQEGSPIYCDEAL